MRRGTHIIASQNIQDRLITITFWIHSPWSLSIVSVSLLILKDLKIAEYILWNGIIESDL